MDIDECTQKRLIVISITLKTEVYRICLEEKIWIEITLSVVDVFNYKAKLVLTLLKNWIQDLLLETITHCWVFVLTNHNNLHQFTLNTSSSSLLYIIFSIKCGKQKASAPGSSGGLKSYLDPLFKSIIIRKTPTHLLITCYGYLPKSQAKKNTFQAENS